MRGGDRGEGERSFDQSPPPNLPPQGGGIFGDPVVSYRELQVKQGSYFHLITKDIERAIYPVGFFRVKAERIKAMSHELALIYNSRVPDEIDELLKLKGVGRKTANLVVTLGYEKPGICVDTHVHRITNRWGYVQTKTPGKTEFALRGKLPRQ